MKKMMATLSILSVLSMAATAVPAFAAEKGNGNIQVNGNHNKIQITNNTIDFSDTKGHWAEKYIKDLVAKKVLNGIGDRKFDPEGKVTREAWATMVARYFNLSNTSTTQDFADVTPDRWSYNYVEATKPYFDSFRDLNGGLDFRPEAGAQREDVAVTLVKILTQLDPSVQLVDASDADAMLKAKFKDSNNIAPSLRPYVATAVKYKLIQGEDGRFAPDRVLSRAEAATLLDRLGDLGLVVDGTTTTDTGGTTTDNGGTTTDNGGTTTDNGGTTTDNGSTATDSGDTTTMSPN